MSALTETQQANLLEWAGALDSGQWRQTQHRLCGEDAVGKSYCCLGVAAEINGILEFRASEVAWGVWGRGPRTSSGQEPPNVLYEATLPGAFASPFFGLTETDQSSLATLNDDCGQDFNDLAKIIRDHANGERTIEESYDRIVSRHRDTDDSE